MTERLEDYVNLSLLQKGMLFLNVIVVKMRVFVHYSKPYP